MLTVGAGADDDYLRKPVLRYMSKVAVAVLFSCLVFFSRFLDLFSFSSAAAITK